MSCEGDRMVYLRNFNKDIRLESLVNSYNYYKDVSLYEALRHALDVDEFYNILEKYCYEKSLEVGFIKFDVEKICDNLGMSYDVFFLHAKNYALNCAGISNAEWNVMINKAANLSKTKRKFERMLEDLYYTDKVLYDEFNNLKSVEEFDSMEKAICWLIRTDYSSIEINNMSKEDILNLYENNNYKIIYNKEIEYGV